MLICSYLCLAVLRLRDLPTRKDIRLKGWNYANAGYYHVTVCIKDRHELLGKVVGAATCRPYVELSEIGRTTDESINRIHKIYPHISVDKYVIMPNHIHLILAVASVESGRQVAAPTPIQTVIGNMKRSVSITIGFSPWQARFYDQIIRDEADYQRVWLYIEGNPGQWADDEYNPKA